MRSWRSIDGFSRFLDIPRSYSPWKFAQYVPPKQNKLRKSCNLRHILQPDPAAQEALDF